MKRLFRRLLETTALVGALCLTGAHAGTVTATVDFDDPGLTGLYFDGDSFTQSGMVMTAAFDFGTVDTAAALGTSGPTGNTTQFFFNSNEGALFLQQAQGLTFNLNSFKAAFVPQNPASAQTTSIAALGFDANGNVVTGLRWLFAPQGAGGRYQFGIYDDPADFVDFTGLSSVAFFSCALSSCNDPVQNNGQFAIDDIQVSIIPEPSSIALTLFALALLVPSLRRRVG